MSKLAKYSSIQAYISTVLQIRLSIRNKMQPTRSLYDIRFKSYGAISAFHVFWWPWPLTYPGTPDIYLQIKSNTRVSPYSVVTISSHLTKLWCDIGLLTHRYILTYRQTDTQTYTSFCEINNDFRVLTTSLWYQSELDTNYENTQLTYCWK